MKTTTRKKKHANQNGWTSVGNMKHKCTVLSQLDNLSIYLVHDLPDLALKRGQCLNKASVYVPLLPLVYTFAFGFHLLEYN